MRQPPLPPNPFRSRAGHCWLRAAGLVAVACTVPPVHAADPLVPDDPRLDPGQQLEQRERERRYYEEREPAEDEPVLESPAPRDDGRLPEDGEQRFVLQGVRFDESRFIDAERLRELARPYVGETVTFADINDLTETINGIYDELGQVTARAIVPPQRIEDGILRVRLVEGRVGAIEFRGREYTEPDYLRAAIELEAGEVLDVPALRRRMRDFNRITPLRLGAQLRAGQEFGQSDVLIGVSEPPRYTGQAFVDNNGSESTGETQYGAWGIWNGPTRRGDRLTAYAVGSEGATSGSLTYARPVPATDGRLSFTVAGADTEIVGGGFAALDITGESTQASVEYLAPAWTGPTWSLDWLARLGWLESTSEATGQPLSDTTIERLALGLEALGGQGRSRWSVQQELIAADSENLLGDTMSYVRFPGRLTWITPAPMVFGAVGRVNATWQYSSDETIAAPAQFQVGGVSTVRGYDNGILSAARGAAVSGELHWQPPWIADVFLFADVGYVNGVSPDSETITSLGAGLNWRHGRWSADVAAAAALDDVVPEQDDYKIHLRLSADLGPGT